MDIDDIRRIAVVGPGLMGHGIALEFTLAGYEVDIHSHSDESLARADTRIRESLDLLVRLGRTSREEADAAPENIHASVDLKQAAGDADVVIESVYEDMALKQEIFRRLDEVCPERTILASDTTALMPSKLASGTQRPDRVLVAHYINPPYLVPFVEVVPGPETSNQTTDTVLGLLKGIGKQPIVLGKKVPGFVASRLQIALLREALWLVENGVASAQDVDTAIKTSIGLRWAVAGVFEVLELAGWDLLSAVADGLMPHLANSSDAPLLREKVDRGELGVKSGRGFYDWTPDSAEALRDRIAEALVKIQEWSGGE